MSDCHHNYIFKVPLYFLRLHFYFFNNHLFTQLFDMKYSYLIQIICMWIYDMKYSYLIQIICMWIYDMKYSYLIQIICMWIYDIKYSYLIQIICMWIYDIKYSYLIQIICYQVGWDCRIHWLLFCRGVRTPTNECPGYDTKQSEGKAPVMLELWEMWSILSLPLLPGQLCPGVRHLIGSYLWVK